MIKPISPNEVVNNVPDFVIEAFNQLISSNFTGNSVTIRQEDIVTLIIEKSHVTRTRTEIFNKGWLNIEENYRKAGWEVVYDKPAYNESYSATFTFTRKK